MENADSRTRGATRWLIKLSNSSPFVSTDLIIYNLLRMIDDVLAWYDDKNKPRKERRVRVRSPRWHRLSHKRNTNQRKKGFPTLHYVNVGEIGDRRYLEVGWQLVQYQRWSVVQGFIKPIFTRVIAQARSVKCFFSFSVVYFLIFKIHIGC